MRVGVHVSIAGGFQEALERAKRLSCNTMQVFSRSPRGGAVAPLNPHELDIFDRRRRHAEIEPLVVHGPYVSNLASPDDAMFHRSVAMYQQEYQRCHQLKAQYLVTHVGSHKGEGEEAGIRRVADALNRTLQSLESPVMILLENTAGSGQGLGYQFEQLSAIRGHVRQQHRVGICWDTAHLFAAGMSIHTEEGLERTIDDFRRIVGMEWLKVCHLNDSKVEWNSRVDRHWHIGQGHIGLEAFRRIVNHPSLRDLPFILETPKDGPDDDPRNLATVRSLVEVTNRARDGSAVPRRAVKERS